MRSLSRLVAEGSSSWKAADRLVASWTSTELAAAVERRETEIGLRLAALRRIKLESLEEEAPALLRYSLLERGHSAEGEARRDRICDGAQHDRALAFEQTVRVLSRFPFQEGTKFLRDLALDDHPEALWAALQLAEVGDRAAIPRLTAAFKDSSEHPVTRQRAAALLAGKFGDLQGIHAFGSQLQRSGDEFELGLQAFWMVRREDRPEGFYRPIAEALRSQCRPDELVTIMGIVEQERRLPADVLLALTSHLGDGRWAKQLLDAPRIGRVREFAAWYLASYLRANGCDCRGGESSPRWWRRILKRTCRRVGEQVAALLVRSELPVA